MNDFFMNELQETAIALEQDYGLQVPEEISEETILQRLAERVAVLVGQGAESFFQMMYRLDRELSSTVPRFVKHLTLMLMSEKSGTPVDISGARRSLPRFSPGK